MLFQRLEQSKQSGSFSDATEFDAKRLLRRVRGGRERRRQGKVGPSVKQGDAARGCSKGMQQGDAARGCSAVSALIKDESNPTEYGLTTSQIRNRYQKSISFNPLPCAPMLPLSGRSSLRQCPSPPLHSPPMLPLSADSLVVDPYLHFDEKVLYVDDLVPDQRLQKDANEPHKPVLHVLVFDVFARGDAVGDVEVDKLRR